jgi:MOSC domain-containing protein YiiM
LADSTGEIVDVIKGKATLSNEELIGHIFQINISAGGVPKLAKCQSEVTFNGLTGDSQRNLKLHGGPERALCLYSIERILDLQLEGHPIFPGAIGENLTLTGLDWNRMMPGVRLQLGSEALVEITRYTSTCNKIANAFENRDYHRVSHEQYPGWSRVYAKVIKEGAVRVGDRVVAEI